MKTIIFFILTFSLFVDIAISAPSFTLSCENTTDIYVYERHEQHFLTISLTDKGALDFGIFNYLHSGEYVKLITDRHFVSYIRTYLPSHKPEFIPNISLKTTLTREGLQYAQWICSDKIKNLGKVTDSPVGVNYTYGHISRCDNVYAFTLSCEDIESMKIYRLNAEFIRKSSDQHEYYLHVYPSRKGKTKLVKLHDDLEGVRCSPGNRDHFKGYIQFERNGERLKSDLPLPSGEPREQGAIIEFFSLQKAQKAADMICPDKAPTELSPPYWLHYPKPGK